MSQATTMTTPIDDANGRMIARKPKTMSKIAHTIDLPDPRLKSPACAMLPPKANAHPLLVHYAGKGLGTVSYYRGVEARTGGRSTPWFLRTRRRAFAAGFIFSVHPSLPWIALRLSCVLGMLNSLEVKVLWPT